MSSSLDKVTTGKYSLQSFIASVAPAGDLSTLAGRTASISIFCKLVILHFLSHFNFKEVS